MCVLLSVYKWLFSPNLVCIKEVDPCKHYRFKDITSFLTLVFRCRSGRKVSKFHWADTRRDTRLVQHQIFISQQRKCSIFNLKYLSWGFLYILKCFQVCSGCLSSVSSCTSVSWLWASYWCVWKHCASALRGKWTPSRSMPLQPCALSSQVRTNNMFWVLKGCGHLLAWKTSRG